MDIDLPPMDDFALPEGETAFPTAGDATRQSVILTSDLVRTEDEEPSSSAAAPMRRRPRQPKVIPPDATIELRNGDLARWNTDYLENMRDLVKTRMAPKMTAQAKKNAEFWTLGRGIMNIGTIPEHPLADLLAGDGLFQLITGISRAQLAGQKHARDSGVEMTEGEDEEGRRVRLRPDDDEAARGFDDEGLGGLGEDDVCSPLAPARALERIFL